MITIRDIHNRLKLLPESAAVGKRYHRFNERAEQVIAKGNPQEIMKLIESGVADDTNSVVLETMLDLYDALYETGNLFNITSYAELIAEKYVSKSRDAKETQTNLKRKIGRVKTAVNTKVNGNIEDITAAIKKAIHGAQANLKTNTAQIQSNVKKGLGKDKEEAKKQAAKNEAFIEGYQKMLDAATKAIYCDRILENYNKLSKRFNIDRIIQENIYMNGIDDTIISICHFVDTYDMPAKVRYNTALECVWYGFGKNFVDCDRKRYVTLITDYYLATGCSRDAAKILLEASMVVDPSDYEGDDMEIIQEEEPEEEFTLKENYMNIHDQILDQVIGMGEVHNIRLLERANFNQIFNKFKASDEEGKETKLGWLVRNLYAKAPNDIVDGTPTLLNYLRLVFVLGTFTLNPVIGAVTLIADLFLSLHMKRENTKKMIECFKKEIATSEQKMKTTNDPDEKARLKKYIAELEKGLKKIDEYYEQQLTDEEVDEKYESEAEDGDDDEFGDGFDGMDDDDFEEMDFNESLIIQSGAIAERLGKLPLTEFAEADMASIVTQAPALVPYLAEAANLYPEMVDKEALLKLVNHEMRKMAGSVRFGESVMFDKSYSYLSQARTTIKYDETPRKTLDPKDTALDFSRRADLLEAFNDAKTTCDYYHPITEGSFTNSIALACEKAKKAMQKLSDKERQISQNIDLAANNTKKAMEKALTTDNRESVIRGSVLPSASKTIKLAITATGLCLIDPVLAVIGALGYLGMSKGYKAKERQMVLDEIEIELKMCEKYIEIAESKNDMKALKRLYTIQKELQQQEKRIKYHMQVKFGQKYYDAHPD